jgi:hypothetical protein
MPKEIVETRNLFTDSAEVISGNCRDFSMNLPQGVLRCNPDQSMRITLNTFSMFKNFYDVNKYNSVFYVIGAVRATGAYDWSAPVAIENGDYQGFTGDQFGLTIKIQTALTAAILAGSGVAVPPNGVVVEYNRLNRLMTITIDQANHATTKFYLTSFTIANYDSAATGIIPTIIGSNIVNAFQSTHIIMGGCKEQRGEVATVADLEPMYNRESDAAGGDVVFVGYYNANLRSETNIYLRTDLQSTSFQTANFDIGDNLFPYIVNSNILAKIPIPPNRFSYVEEYNKTQNQITSVFDYEADCETITFMDNGNNVFSILMASKGVGSLRLFITDSFGRVLPEISKEQIDCSSLAFTTSLRVDVFQETSAS